VFEYWGINRTQEEFEGEVQARVRFYANDGPPFSGYPTPGTVLYDSGPSPWRPPSEPPSSSRISPATPPCP